MIAPLAWTVYFFGTAYSFGYFEAEGHCTGEPDFVGHAIGAFFWPLTWAVILILRDL